jgi:hypothetical protein
MPYSWELNWIFDVKMHGHIGYMKKTNTIGISTAFQNISAMVILGEIAVCEVGKIEHWTKGISGQDG